MKQNEFPTGWNEERVRRILAHYEQQSEEEAVAEDEAAFKDHNETIRSWMFHWSLCRLSVN